MEGRLRVITKRGGARSGGCDGDDVMSLVIFILGEDIDKYDEMIQ
jgi:hypothetical protein